MNQIDRGDYRPLSSSIPKFKEHPRNPCNPSIPSKWENKSRIENSTTAGFGNTTQRFKNHLNVNPGPGFYHEEKGGNSMLFRSNSLSKKGFGNAFLSKTSRLGSVLRNDLEAGPGEYSIKTVEQVYEHASDPSSAFTLSGKGRVPFRDPMANGPRPGPGEYNVAVRGRPQYIDNKQSSTFASRSGRDSFLNKSLGKNDVTPSPFDYNPNPAARLPDQKIMWSKSKFKRFQDIGYDNKVPGPCLYFDAERSSDLERQQQTKNHRVIGRKPSTGSFLGKQNEKKSETQHTFGADVDRFKHSFLGRIDLAAESPGPGWYAPLDIIPSNKPGDSTSKSENNKGEKLMATFKSTAPHRQAVIKPLEHRTPGPAYYHPAPVKSFKKFSVNVDSKWV